MVWLFKGKLRQPPIVKTRLTSADASLSHSGCQEPQARTRVPPWLILVLIGEGPVSRASLVSRAAQNSDFHVKSPCFKCWQLMTELQIINGLHRRYPPCCQYPPPQPPTLRQTAQSTPSFSSNFTSLEKPACHPFLLGWGRLYPFFALQSTFPRLTNCPTWTCQGVRGGGKFP